MRKTKAAKPANKNIKRAALDAKKLETVQGGATTIEKSPTYCPPLQISKGNGYYSCG